MKYFLLLLLSFLTSIAPLFAQEKNPSPQGETSTQQSTAAESEDAKRVTAKIQSLDSIIKTSKNLRESISDYDIKKELTDEQKSELAQLQRDLDSLDKNFTEISSGINIESFQAEGGSKGFDWGSELKTLLQPLINELKRVTSQPREIDKYKTVIGDLENQIELTKKAIENIALLLVKSEKKELNQELELEKSSWENRLLQSETELSISNQKLQSRLNNRKSLLETVSSLPDLFFKGRAQNLFIAILSVFLFWLFLNRLRNFVARKHYFRSRQKTFRTRLFNVLYLSFRSLGSILVFMLALFLLGDWVLLIIGGLFLLGVLWTSKQLIPMFWTQATIMLNIGAVREGERVEYNGLPWRVKTLNFYSHFVNPALDYGTIRVPIKDLNDLRSRHYGESEPWFPTMNGDWVVLDDDTYGRVTWQGIDQVKVTEHGGAVKTYSTPNYLDQNPRNLSSGFRISISFGVDYGIQAISTTEVPSKLQSFIEENFEEEKLSKRCKLKVEFEEAAASSLNIAVICDFNGDLGSRYQSLARFLNKLCVDACNENNWEIPFGQLTVHMANESS